MIKRSPWGFIIVKTTAITFFLLSTAQAFAADVSLSLTATAEEQQVNQPGLVFNNAIFGQGFPTAPNYFASTRVTAGRRISYQANVANLDGMAPSPSVTLNIVIPTEGVLYQGSLTTTAGSCQAQPAGSPTGSLICSLGAIAAGGSASVAFQVVTDPEIPAGSNLLAGASASISGDTNLGNNFGTAQTTVLNAADMTVGLATLGLVSSYSSTQGQIIDTSVLNGVTAGNILHHRVEVQNNGPSSALAAIVQHTLPNGFNYEDAYGARCIPDGLGLNVIYCEVEDVGANNRVAYDLYVTVDPFTTDASSLQSCIISISAASNTSPPGSIPGISLDPPLLPLTWDPLTGNNSACTVTDTDVLVDAGVSFEETSVQADYLGAVHYAPLVRNEGRSGLLDATLTVSFPTGLTLLGGSQECVFAGSSAVCAVMPLSPGETHSFDVIGSVSLDSESVEALNVTAAISGISPADANSLNNSTSALTVVRPTLNDSETTISLKATSSDFDIDSGTWGINNRGDFFSFEKGKARALVKPSKLASFKTGTLQADLRLLKFKKTKPNASMIFAHQSSEAYRFVKLELRGRKGRILLGQVGQIGEEVAGIKALAKFPLKRGKVYNVNVQVGPDGTVTGIINNSDTPIVSYKFAEGAQSGRAGYEAVRARAAFDILSVVADK